MKKQFDQLIDEVSFCTRCLELKKKNGKDCSLINFYKDKKMCRNIPSIWTDWYRRLDSNIMMIGQDWGPYTDMEKLYHQYREEQTEKKWIDLIESEKSLTKKMLTKYLIDSAAYHNISIEQDFLDKIFITNAIMCARGGNHYRGDNIKLKESTLNCSEFLEKQIQIVNPKVILTLGYYPLLSISKIFDFKIENNLNQCIEKHPIIFIKDYVIIPLYHPTAQIKGEIQLEQYNRIWEFI